MARGIRPPTSGQYPTRARAWSGYLTASTPAIDHRTARGWEDSGEHLEGRRLASPVATDERDGGSGWYRQVEAINRRDRSKGHRQIRGPPLLRSSSPLRPDPCPG